MIKKVILALAVVGCSLSVQARNTSEVTKDYDLPPGMADCKIYKLTDGILSPILFVTKCPMSKTSTTFAQKNPTNTILEDEDVPAPPIIQMNGKRYMEIK